MTARDFRLGARLPGLGPGASPEPVPADRVRVPFAGPGAGRAPLSWGQRDIWATMVRQRNWLPQGGRRPLAPGTGVDDVAAELAYLHSRYPSLRTRLAFEPSGTASQEVSASGETVLEVFDTPSGEDPDAVAARVEAVYRHRPYDLRTEWPVRMAVVRDGGVAAHLVVLMHHLALDAAGAAIMMREAAARETAEPSGMQPLEQAVWQASEAGRRHDARVLRHFEDALHTLPVRTSASLGGPRQPRHWSGRFVSPVLAAAAETIGARTGVDAPSVLTALTGIALARLGGTKHVVFRPRVGNRFRPALAGVVCFAAQSGLMVLDLAGTTFDEAVERARRASLTAMKNAYFDPVALAALLTRTAENGRDLGVPVFFNDRRAAGPAVDYALAPTPGRPRDTSAFEWLHRSADPTEPLSLTIDVTAAGLVLAWDFDTHVIAPERVEGLAWAIEEAAGEAAKDGGASTGI